MTSLSTHMRKFIFNKLDRDNHAHGQVVVRAREYVEALRKAMRLTPEGRTLCFVGTSQRNEGERT